MVYNNKVWILFYYCIRYVFKNIWKQFCKKIIGLIKIEVGNFYFLLCIFFNRRKIENNSLLIPTYLIKLFFPLLRIKMFDLIFLAQWKMISTKSITGLSDCFYAKVKHQFSMHPIYLSTFTIKQSNCNLFALYVSKWINHWKLL